MSDTPDVDVFLSGLLFVDVVFTGLPQAPELGKEIWSDGLGTGPGGIANFAVALSRLGLRTGLAAAFGDDFYGRYCWETLESGEGIDLSRSRRFPGWPMPVTAALAYDGDRALVTHGLDSPVPLDDLAASPPSCRAAVVHLTEHEPTWVREVAKAGGKVFADTGWDPAGAWSPRLLEPLADCHAFLPNEHEAMAYTRTGTAGQALSRLADLVPLAVVTRGAAGALAVDATTGETAQVDGLHVTAVDPTGAGDVFGAAMVAGTLSGWPLADRLRFANLCAALSVRGPGGAPSTPDWAAVAGWWRDTSATGDPDLSRDYAFLDDILP
ncbi:carbohydrate kinase family protein, partial [Catenuloplanes japonicus]|uniref:carbohydrate kinase family protein n=1 Tax=Catenuloplanes japonicus TaxID=33876 RepID=UPI000524F415